MAITLDGTTGITTPGLTNTGTETIVNLTTTGNTILGNATTDTLNVASGTIVTDGLGKVGVGLTPASKLDVLNTFRVSYESGSIYYASITNISGGTVINANGDSAGMTFGTTAVGGSTPTTNMTLDSSGNLLVGTTAALAAASLGKFNVQATTGVSAIYASNSASFASAVVQIGCGTNSGTGWNILEGYSANGGADQFAVKRFQIIGNGNVQNTNNSYGAISDIKLKENIVDTSPKLDKLLQVKIRNYNLKTDPDHKQIGVIAQELETVFPSLIEETEDKETVTKTREVDGVEEEYTEQVPTGETTKAVKYSVFVPILIKAIQEQQALITSLTARLEVLEAK